MAAFLSGRARARRTVLELAAPLDHQAELYRAFEKVLRDSIFSWSHQDSKIQSKEGSVSSWQWDREAIIFRGRLGSIIEKLMIIPNRARQSNFKDTKLRACK